MKNELPLMRPTIPPARPKKNTITTQRHALHRRRQSSVLSAQSTAMIAATATTIQKIAITKPITIFASSTTTTRGPRARGALRERGLLGLLAFSNELMQSVLPGERGAAGASAAAAARASGRR